MKNQGPSIFVVEDDKYFANMIKEFLGRNNYRNVQVYNNGEDCLKNLQQIPDVVILDHRLGEMSGLEVLRKIKSTNPNIHVIFLTAQRKMNVAINSLKYGAFDYLEKNEESLQRLLVLIRQIRLTNDIVIKNREFKTFQYYFFGALFFIVCSVIYLSWRFPSLFD
ncbi:MAG: DNA-binding NtrC family response regulator [Psychroserpens sp.]|jgi:DNA-binding NtrC family response regulator